MGQVRGRGGKTEGLCGAGEGREGRWRGCVGQVRGREDGGAVWGR